jgi:hypothetical protein
MNWHEKWAHEFYRSGYCLIKNAWYPAVAFGLAHVILAPEAALEDCIATATFVLSAIVTASMFCFGVSLGISISDSD